MAVTTGYFVNGIDIGSYFGAKGASTAITTGYRVHGTDLNQLLLARADGVDIGFNTGYEVHGVDLRSIFGAPSGNAPLPINGQTFSATSQSGVVSISCQAVFGASTSGWTVSGFSSTGGGVPSASGSLPSGAVSVQYSFTVISSAGTGSVTNGASSITSLTGSSTNFTVAASSTPLTGDNHRSVALTINFFNGSGTNISTTVITIQATATGSA